MNVREDRIEIHAPLVPLALEMAIGPPGLLNAGVSELVFDPSEVRASLEHPGSVRMAHGVRLPVVELGGLEKRPPDQFREGPVAGDPPGATAGEGLARR